MDISTTPSEPPLSDPPPSTRQRLFAVIGLSATAVAIILLVLFVTLEPVLLVGGLVGLALVGAGGWWLITERNPRRAIGIAGIAMGLMIMALAVFKATADGDTNLWHFGVLLLVMAIGILAARGALVNDLHVIDKLRSGRVQPHRPVLICNPKSGGGKVDKFGLIPMAEQMGIGILILEPGMDLAQLARDAIAGGADCLGMAGGDGSQARVASIAIEHQIPFVCISAGTRNHFAQDLGLDRENPRAGMIALCDGVERQIDYATVGDRLFVNNVSLGVYATIVRSDDYREAKVETTKEQLPGLLGSQAEPFDLQFTTPDGREIDGAFLIMVSNNQYVTSPSLDVSQRRSIDDGVLGVFAVTAKTGAEAGRLVASTTFGLGQIDPNLHQFGATTFEVRSHSGRALAGVDGESLSLPTPLQFKIHPKGMRILVPESNVLQAEKRRARGINIRALLAIAEGRTVSRLGT